MKRILHFVVSHLSASRKPYRWIYTAPMLLLMVFIPVYSAVAQSRDRDKPTQLTSNEISGLIGDNIGDNYNYSFVAGPGEVSITLSVEAGRVHNPQWNNVGFDLFNEEGRRIAMKWVMALNGNTNQEVEHISFTRRQRVLLRIIIGDYNVGSGKYKLQLSGAVDVGQEQSGKSGVNPNADFEAVLRDTFPCDEIKRLPKKGILHMKMKDGSIQRFDLSKIETLCISDTAR